MQSVSINNLTFDEYLSQQEIATIVAQVAERINADYAGREPLFICVLNGAFMYASDLFKLITLPAEITFVRLKSYEGTATTGKVNMLIPLQTSVKDRDVIIIEDIVDTGTTLKHLKAYLMDRNPKCVKICTLLDKPSRRVADIKADYIGFEIDNLFVVGYGLDYDQKYRNLPYVSYLEG